MKKYFKLFLGCLCAVLISTAQASAEDYFVSDIIGATMQDKIVTVTENEAEITYEWFADVGGNYSVSFNDVVVLGCNVSAIVNDGYEFKIADITKPLSMGLDSGFNKIALKIEKASADAVFSIGTITLTYEEDTNTETIHIEANKDSFTHITSGYIYYENYGSDMSEGDVILMQKSSVPEITYVINAPVDGDYAMSAVLSHLGQTFTSDVNMKVNGMDYPLTADTMTRVKNLTNASDSGLMKLYNKKHAVHLKKGFNTITFSAIEKRNAGDLYIFFIDCVDFTFVNKPIEFSESINTSGEYTYDVSGGTNTQYELEFDMITSETEQALADCSVSADGGSYIKLVKGETVKVVSEYIENGTLYGKYRLSDCILVKSQLSFKLDSENAVVEKISLIPAISGLSDIYASSDKVILLPGESADISVFATDKNGYALNLNYLRKNGGVTFKSSDREILAVDALGCVRALKPGNAHITVASSDGTDTKLFDVEFNVYNEKYGFTLLSAEKDEDYVKVRILSPFGVKENAHTMVIAEYDGEHLSNVTVHNVEALEKGQIVTCKMPTSKNLFKIISVNSLTDIKPVYEVVTAKEG